MTQRDSHKRTTYVFVGEQKKEGMRQKASFRRTPGDKRDLPGDRRGQQIRRGKWTRGVESFRAGKRGKEGKGSARDIFQGDRVERYDPQENAKFGA